MLHLPIERLAALADDEPTALEAEHLASCVVCARERAAHATIIQMAAGERARLAPPLTQWNRIAAGLREENLLRAPSRELPPVSGRWWMRAAAAIVLVAGGIAIGRVSAGETPVPWPGAGMAGGQVGESVPELTSREEAEAVLVQAEASYQEALRFLAELDASQLPQREDALRERLAALHEVASTTVRALNEVPYDPVLNSYYLSTLGAREATLRQLDAVLPEGARLTSF